MIGQGKLIDKDGARRWLVEKTQHRIGGFGKEPGYPPGMLRCYYLFYMMLTPNRHLSFVPRPRNSLHALHLLSHPS